MRHDDEEVDGTKGVGGGEGARPVRGSGRELASRVDMIKSTSGFGEVDEEGGGVCGRSDGELRCGVDVFGC